MKKCYHQLSDHLDAYQWREKEVNNSVVCNERFIVKAIKLAFLVIWFLIVFLLTFGQPESFAGSPILRLLVPLLWIVFVLISIIFLFGSPDLSISPDGLIVKILWQKFPVYWNDITLIRSDAFQSWIFVRKLTPFNYLIGLGVFRLSPAFQVGKWRKNYIEFESIVKEKLGNKFIQL